MNEPKSKLNRNAAEKSFQESLDHLHLLPKSQPQTKQQKQDTNHEQEYDVNWEDVGEDLEGFFEKNQ